MRNKIKQLLKKEEGFTLVELLAVIVILGFILVIAVPGITKVIDGSKKKTEDQQEMLLIDAAKLYFIDEEFKGSAKTEVTPKDLYEGGYLEGKNTDKYSKDKSTKITKDNVKDGTLTTTTP